MNTTKRNTKKAHYIFKLVKENVEPSVQGVIYPRSRTIVALDEVYDEETSENRIIRYLPGETSIFLDEQTDQDLRKRRPHEITFVNGSLVVDKRQATLLKFIQACNFFKGNTNRMPGKEIIFEEYAPEVTAKSAMEDDMKIANAKAMVYGMELKELISYARILDVDINRPVDSIRWDMASIAGDDPNWFIENKNSPNTTRMHYLFEAIDMGIIKVTNKDRTVRWANGQAIVQAPLSVEPLDALVDLTFEKDGEAIYEAIINKIRIPEDREEEKQLTGADILKSMDTKEAPFKEQPKEKVEEKERFSASKMETSTLFDMAYSEGIIEKKGPAHYMYKGVRLGNGRANSIEFLDDPKKEKMKKAIIRALEVKKNA
jgi:hypothetical protein